MIPSTGDFLINDFELAEQPSRTYRMYPEQLTIRGYMDGIETIRQLVYKILGTERYRYVIYSRNFGVELLDLYGKPTSYVCPELKRRITEALIQDSRITGVDDFNFETKKNAVHVTFTVRSVFGDVEAEKAVTV